jgi:hypothetical protein
MKEQIEKRLEDIRREWHLQKEQIKIVWSPIHKNEYLVVVDSGEMTTEQLEAVEKELKLIELEFDVVNTATTNSDMLDLMAEQFPDMSFLKADGFDSAIMGFEYSSGRIIYSVKKCINILIVRDGMDDDEARDFFWYNVEGAYIGEQTPIWCYDEF